MTLTHEAFRGVCRERLIAQDFQVSIGDFKYEPAAMGLSELLKAQILEEERAKQLERMPAYQRERIERQARRNRSTTEGRPFAHLAGDATPACPISKQAHIVNLATPEPAVPGVATPQWLDEGRRQQHTQHAAAISVQGLADPTLNTTYNAQFGTTVSGHPTYWNRQITHFLYFDRLDGCCTLCPRVSGTNEDLLEVVQRGERRGIAFQRQGSDWQEWWHDQWISLQVRVTVHRSPPAAGTVPPAQLAPAVPPPLSPVATPQQARQHVPTGQVDTVVFSGFNTLELNTSFYLDPSLQIGGRATYWDRHRRYFMYYQAAQTRWAVSKHEPAQWAAYGGAGDDALSDALRGGIRGVACEEKKGGLTWHEWWHGRWVSIVPSMQRLSTGHRMSLPPLSGGQPPAPTPSPSAFAPPAAAGAGPSLLALAGAGAVAPPPAAAAAPVQEPGAVAPAPIAFAALHAGTLPDHRSLAAKPAPPAALSLEAALWQEAASAAAPARPEEQRTVPTDTAEPAEEAHVKGQPTSSSDSDSEDPLDGLLEVMAGDEGAAEATAAAADAEASPATPSVPSDGAAGASVAAGAAQEHADEAEEEEQRRQKKKMKKERKNAWKKKKTAELEEKLRKQLEKEHGRKKTRGRPPKAVATAAAEEDEAPEAVRKGPRRGSKDPKAGKAKKTAGKAGDPSASEKARGAKRHKGDGADFAQEPGLAEKAPAVRRARWSASFSERWPKSDLTAKPRPGDVE